MPREGPPAEERALRRRALLSASLAAVCLAMLLPAAAPADWKGFTFSANFYNEYGWCQAYGEPVTATAPGPGGCQGKAASGPSPWTSGASVQMDWGRNYTRDVGVVKDLRITSNLGTSAANIKGYLNTPQWERMIVVDGSFPGYPVVKTGTDWNQHPGWYNGAFSLDMEYHQQWFHPKSSGYSIAMQGWLGTP